MHHLRPSLIMIIQLLIIISIITIPTTFNLPILPNNVTGFSLEMIHLLSPTSPFDHANLTDFQMIERLSSLSTKRADSLASGLGTAATSAQFEDDYTILPDVLVHELAYVVVVHLGTPAQMQYMLMDTGSNIMWVECNPCYNCSFQNPEQVFSPNKSSSYRNFSCIREGRTHDCPSRTDCVGGRCVYAVDYVAGAYAKGEIVVDTFRFPSPEAHRLIPIDDIMFGCSHVTASGKRIGYINYAGILGMSPHELSFVGQFEAVGLRFSYCLVNPITHKYARTYLRVGNAAGSRASNPNFQSTPFKASTDLRYHYNLNLTGISVGTTTVGLPWPRSTDANCMIDSGSAFSSIDSELFGVVAAIVKGNLLASGLKFLEGDSRCLPGFTEVCFEWPAEGKALYLPEITFHFEGANFTLPDRNAFFLDHPGGIFFLAMKAFNRPYSIFGAWQQHDFRILYELTENKLYFGEQQCTEDS